jgi:hypothetical protein
MKNWVRSGLVWGGVLYIITMIAFPMLDGERLNTTKIIMGIPLWIVVGLTIGYLLKDRKKSKAKPKATAKKKR